MKTWCYQAVKLNKATGLYKNSAHLLKDSVHARRRYHLYIAIKGTFSLYLEKFESCTLHSKLYPYIRKVINRNLRSVSIFPTFCNIIERAFNTQIYGKNEKTTTESVGVANGTTRCCLYSMWIICKCLVVCFIVTWWLCFILIYPLETYNISKIESKTIWTGTWQVVLK